MSAHTLPAQVLPDQERRSLQPSRTPSQGIRPGNTPREGPPVPGLAQDEGDLYWIVLHCAYATNSQEEQEH
jgi:hypothetical protein